MPASRAPARFMLCRSAAPIPPPRNTIRYPIAVSFPIAGFAGGSDFTNRVRFIANFVSMPIVFRLVILSALPAQQHAPGFYPAIFNTAGSHRKRASCCFVVRAATKIWTCFSAFLARADVLVGSRNVSPSTRGARRPHGMGTSGAYARKCVERDFAKPKIWHVVCGAMASDRRSPLKNAGTRGGASCLLLGKSRMMRCVGGGNLGLGELRFGVSKQGCHNERQSGSYSPARYSARR